MTNLITKTKEELKNIYKKRWSVETSFKVCKTHLKIDLMKNKNFNRIKQNIYITQFILIMNAFIIKLLNKYTKTQHHLQTSLILSSLHTDIFELIFSLLNKKENFQNIVKKKKI